MKGFKVVAASLAMAKVCKSEDKCESRVTPRVLIAEKAVPERRQHEVLRQG